MELVFTQVGNNWVAEFQVEADFNLHIERPSVGYMYLQQRGSANGDYDTAHSFNSGELVIDTDIAALVYPKYIKIVSAVQPVYAEVTSSGNVTML